MIAFLHELAMTYVFCEMLKVTLLQVKKVLIENPKFSCQLYVAIQCMFAISVVNTFDEELNIQILV